MHAMDEMESCGFDVTYLNVDENGFVDLKQLESSITNETTLISIMYANNETGSIQNIKEISNIIKNKSIELKRDIYFHTDAVQAAGKLSLDVKDLGVDLMTISGHKFHGPKGVGFSYVNKNCGINPFIFGGAQERGLRAGTEALPNILGMEKAITISYKNLIKEKKYIQSLKDYFIKSIKIILPNVKFNGCSSDPNESTYTLVNVALPIVKEKAALLDFHLDLKGIACSKGSACQSGSNQGSHVINEIQENKNIDWPSLRFSFSKFNSKKEYYSKIDTANFYSLPIIKTN